MGTRFLMLVMLLLHSCGLPYRVNAQIHRNQHPAGTSNIERFEEEAEGGGGVNADGNGGGEDNDYDRDSREDDEDGHVGEANEGDEEDACANFDEPKLEALFCEDTVNQKGNSIRRCAVTCAAHYHSAELGDDFDRNENFYAAYECDKSTGEWISHTQGTKYGLRCQREGCTKPYGEGGTSDAFHYERVECAKLFETPTETHYSYCTVKCAPGYFAYQSGAEQGNKVKQQMDCIEGRYQLAEGSSNRLQCSKGGTPFGFKNAYQDAYGMSTFCQHVGSLLPSPASTVHVSRVSACEPTCNDDLNIVQAHGSPFDTAKFEYMNGKPNTESEIRCEQGSVEKSPPKKFGYVTKCDDNGSECMFRCDESKHYVRTRPGVFGDKDYLYVRLGRWTYEFSPMRCAPKCGLMLGHAQRRWSDYCPPGTGACQGINDVGEHFCWHEKLNNSGVDYSQLSVPRLRLGNDVWTRFWRAVEKAAKSVYKYLYETTDILDNNREE